eukprot:NODE_319_length_9908_cov_1.288001.p6 type:complete len:303 gc:universal NODE_319_length_9908_cov_1.288001:6574-5666(-)
MKDWSKFDVEKELDKVDQEAFESYHQKNSKTRESELADLYSQKGKIYFQKNQYRKAITEYIQAIKCCSKSSKLSINCNNNIGLCHIKLNEFDCAICYLQNVVNVENNAKAFFRLATCYKNLDRIEDAINLLSKFKGHDKDIENIKNQLFAKPSPGMTNHRIWTPLNIEYTYDDPSDVDEAIDLKVVEDNSTNLIIAENLTSTLLIDDASKLPLAKNVAELQSNLNILPYHLKIEHISQYSYEKYNDLFQDGIEAEFIELIIQAIKDRKDRSIFWKNLKSLDRFQLAFMFVKKDLKLIAETFE